MNNFVKGTWVNGKGTPLNADNLNRIEDGIQEALDGVEQTNTDLKKYCDNNIKYFQKEVAGGNTDIQFRIPGDINFSKYIPLVQTNASGPEEGTKILSYGAGFISIDGYGYIQITSDGDVIFKGNKYTPSTLKFKIILLPVQDISNVNSQEVDEI